MSYFEQKQFSLSNKIEEKQQIDIENFDDARQFIIDEFELGHLPIISVPEQYANATHNGLKAHTTWIGDKFLVGTIGRNPYLPDSNPRRLFRIHVTPEQVIPRFTGPDRHFHGIIVFKEGKISPAAIEEIQH